MIFLQKPAATVIDFGADGPLVEKATAGGKDGRPICV